MVTAFAILAMFRRNIHICATYKVGPSQCFLQRMMSWAPECQVCASTEVGSWFLCFSSRRVGPYIHQNTVLQFSLWNRVVSVAVLAVHVSKKHGIRGESGDREGTSANCLPWLRSAYCCCCWWHARVTRWDSFAEENEKGNWVGFEMLTRYLK